MRLLCIILTAVFLSSCATHLQMSEKQIIQQIDFVGARNDLLPELQQNQQTLTERLHSDGNVKTITFPLTYAIECNATKIACKHAVVKTQLEFTAQITAENNVKLSGVLRSEMARSLSLTTPPSTTYSQTYSMAIPNEVEVIREFKDDHRIDKLLRLGEKLNLKGLAGVRVTIEFQ